MALDWALLQLRGEERIPDTLRLYWWGNRTVSLGYSQDLERELDVPRCLEAGVDVVFRPTGGAMVLHDGDLTYSVVAGIREADPAGRELFSVGVSRALCRGLKELGLEPVVMAGKGAAGRRDRGACFSMITGHEITVDGRKIAGNARRWKKGAILQHGSIPLRSTELSVVDLMAGLTPEQRISRREELERQSTTVEDETGRTVTYNEFWPLILDGFRAEFGGTFGEEDPGAIELDLADEYIELVTAGKVRRGRTGRSRVPDIRHATNPVSGRP